MAHPARVAVANRIRRLRKCRGPKKSVGLCLDPGTTMVHNQWHLYAITSPMYGKANDGVLWSIHRGWQCPAVAAAHVNAVA